MRSDWRWVPERGKQLAHLFDDETERTFAFGAVCGLDADVYDAGRRVDAAGDGSQLPKCMWCREVFSRERKYEVVMEEPHEL